MKNQRLIIAGLLALLPALAPLSLRAADVVAVLSGDSGPYKEALDGLKAEIPDVEAATLPALPKLDGAKVVVSFGGEAALKKYPAGVALVAALLPDPKLKPGHGGNLTRVGIPPAPAVLIEKIKSVASGNLAVFDSGNYGDYCNALKAAGAAAGMPVTVKKVEDMADLATKLPGLKGSAKALWIPPDPLFMNPKTFGLLVAFCKGSGIALIAPVPALAKAGAAAGVAPSFRQQGQAAATAAKAYAAGSDPGAWVYSEKVEFLKGN
jgi:hypothetical protein